MWNNIREGSRRTSGPLKHLWKEQKGKVLSKEEKDKLEIALENTTELFDGKLGLYKDEEIHLEIEPSAKPLQHELTLFQSLTKKLSNEKWTTY